MGNNIIGTMNVPFDIVYKAIPISLYFLQEGLVITAKKYLGFRKA